jgi:lipopolysaccharide biosynthesis regulator YciM
MWELLFLLLPLAALSGWLLGKRQPFKRKAVAVNLAADYYDGLHYLLNEQVEKAMESFSRMLNVNANNVEANLMLGHLFRRKGEVDKAIRIHQDLLAKPSLTAKQRCQSLLALGQDYLCAGVYDRAESLFQELSDVYQDISEKSLQFLINIYEIEKDWDKAIEVSKQLQNKTMEYMGVRVAQYYCEKALIAKQRGDLALALKDIKYALQADRRCVRASILQGDIEVSAGRYKSALKAYKRVVQQDCIFLPEVIERIVKCYEKLDAGIGLDQYLQQVLQEYPNITIVLAYANRLQQQQKTEEALQFITRYLRQHPSIMGLNHLVAFHLFQSSDNELQGLLNLQALIGKLLANKPVYQCQSCGFSAKSMHWHCPGCKQWGIVKPIAGLELESKLHT